MLELLGWATTRAVARQFMELTKIADWNAEQQVMIPRKDIQLHPFRPNESIDVVKVPAVMDGMTVVTPAVMAPGFHFNLRLFGDLENTLRNDAPDPDGDYWNKWKLVTYVNTKLGTAGALVNKEVTGAKLPGGYQWSVGPNTVRLYDAAAVAQRANVWQ